MCQCWHNRRATCEVIKHLLSVEFLGWQTGVERFSFGAEGSNARLAQVLARKYAATSNGALRYRIHPAFWDYLEISGATKPDQ